MRLLILEDNPKDAQIAADIGRQEGFEEIEVFTSLAPAMQTMEQALSGDRPLPHALLLDLNLGVESGYDLLRLWHRTRAESKIRVDSHLIVGKRASLNEHGVFGHCCLRCQITARSYRESSAPALCCRLQLMSAVETDC
jgi:hypothetical protein